MRTKDDDLTFITEHQEEWPQWPNLPMKRPFFLPPPHGGMINAIEGGLTRVWIMGPAQFAQILATGGTFTCEEYREYPTVSAMLDDGWVID
jgi:hypothetical protein